MEEAGFISTFLPLGHTRKGIHYRVIDEYTLFYLKWIEPYRTNTRASSTSSHWTTITKTSSWYTWAGYSFEAVCYKHIESIKKAIGIDKVQSLSGDWRYFPEKGGAGTQIDLVFDREDDCVTLCEIKHTDKPFVITKDYAQELEKKQTIYKAQTRTKKQILWCIITNNDVAKNAYFHKLISQAVTFKDLFIE